MDNLDVTKVYWGHKLMAFEETEVKASGGDSDELMTKVKVTFEASTSTNELTSSTTSSIIYGDLLVAADGIRSAVVQQLYSKRLQRKLKQSRKRKHQHKAGGIDKERFLEKGEALDNDFIANNNTKKKTGLRPMKVRLVLGITENFNHAFVNERGFYTLDGTHRLFTMPYETDKWNLLCGDEDGTDNNSNSGEGKKKKNRVMWQLSYAIDDDKDGQEATASNDATVSGNYESTPSPIFSNSKALKENVLQRCQSWHDPVSAMIESTPLEMIWGT